MAHHLPNIPELYTLMFTIYHHVVVDDVMTDRNMFIFPTFTPFCGLLEMTIQLDSENTSGYNLYFARNSNWPNSTDDQKNEYNS